MSYSPLRGARSRAGRGRRGKERGSGRGARVAGSHQEWAICVTAGFVLWRRWVATAREGRSLALGGGDGWPLRWTQEWMAMLPPLPEGADPTCTL